MVKKRAQQVFGDEEFEPITLAETDFLAAPDEGETVEAGEIAEVFRSEIEEDGQLASYDALQLGQRIDPTGNSAKGKIFVDLYDDTTDGGASVDPRTQVRFIARPKNGNRRTALTDWMTIRDLARDDPRQRRPLPPVKDEDGDPRVVSSGRIVAMEVRNGATSITVSKANSVVSVPAVAGY